MVGLPRIGFQTRTKSDLSAAPPIASVRSSTSNSPSEPIARMPVALGLFRNPLKQTIAHTVICVPISIVRSLGMPKYCAASLD